MNESTIQRDISDALNVIYPEPWGAFRATTRDGMEYVEFRNEETDERFIISIVKGL